MKILRMGFLLLSLFLGNIPFIIMAELIPAPAVGIVFALGIVVFLVFQVIPMAKKTLSLRLRILNGGYVLLWNGAVGLLLECLILLLQWFVMSVSKSQVFLANPYILLFSGLFSLLVMVISGYNGVIRIVITSGQLKFPWKVLLLTTMWIPIWNLYLVWKVCNVVKKEYVLESDLQIQDLERLEKHICKTEYPIVMVHGVFFRDWQLMNYWGRIPGELIRNGATVFYGNQESALPVEKSAEEVKRHILDAIEKTGAKKVNVIAHSKGGLDTRYAISCLGMEQYVASLTTINTPHRGCVWAEKTLQKIPNKVVQSIAKKYNRVFHKLGDLHPDFYAAVEDLTFSRCTALNELMPDKDSVYYQSVTSIMKKRRSAGFPLNLVYPIVRKAEGDNDGLVAIESAKWGKFLGVLQCEGMRGISHADMIDLMRENIDGFNVREYYIKLVKGLKEKGF